jgi:RNA polymerase sigma-B factor
MPTSATVLHDSPSRQLELGIVRQEALFEQCQRGGDRAARNALVQRFLPLARRLARRYAHSSVPSEDLIQVANLALVKAVDRFDPERGTAFGAFAIPTILGELKRYFRDSAWAVHVTRAAQERALAVEEASDQLINELGRAPRVREIAGHMELSEEDVLDGLQAARAFSTMSLEAPSPSLEAGSRTSLEADLGVEDERFELIEDGVSLSSAVRQLPQSEQRMLRLRFVEEMTQSEIGARLGISQMQVSRLLRRALTRLQRLAGADQADEEDPRIGTQR